MEEMQYEPPVIFSLINDNEGNTLSIFTYNVFENDLFISLEDENE